MTDNWKDGPMVVPAKRERPEEPLSGTGEDLPNHKRRRLDQEEGNVNEEEEEEEEEEDGGKEGEHGPEVFDMLPDEMVLLVLEHAVLAGDIARTAVTSKRMHAVVCSEDNNVWKRSVLHQIRERAIERKHVERAVADKGWRWMRRALDPLTKGTTGIGYTYLLSSELHVFGESLKGKTHGYALSISRMRDVCYTGEWSHGYQHGHGAMVCQRGRIYSGSWSRGVPSGHLIDSCCVCRKDDDDDERNEKPSSYVGDVWNRHVDLHLRTTKYGYYGFVNHIERVREGRALRKCKTLFCNGDTKEYMEADVEFRINQHGNMEQVPVRLDGNSFTMSARCPDPRFRSVHLKGFPWCVYTSERPTGGPLKISYPNPATAPNEFRIYHDYFKCGFLMVESRDREQVAAIFEEAARLLPA